MPLLVTDDEVIEQRQIEHVGGGIQSQREPRVVGTSITRPSRDRSGR